MKKLLSILLVLSLSVVANAGLLDISVNGELAPDEITLMPSDVITIDVMISQGTITGYVLALELSNPQAEMDSAEITFPTLFDFPGTLAAGRPDYIEVTGSQFFGAPVPGPAVLIDNILLHCTEPTDVVLDLIALDGTTINGEVVQGGTVLDSLIIHQIPEPMTLTLLGLGGLLLRRRK